jgi:repressor LexA
MGRTPAGQTRKRIFEFMRQRLLAGAPPTVREVQQAFGFRAVQSAREHLEALVAEGLLSKAPGRSRGYGLPASLERATETRLVPLLGRVQAGRLTTALEDPEGYLPIPSRFAEKELFALRVKGDSMIDAAILENDIVIVRRQPNAESGAIVVALVEDEATVKRLRKRGRRIELVPENPAYDVIPITASHKLRLLGKVVEVRRYLEAPALIPPQDHA